jgi:hypothetical protein
LVYTKICWMPIESKEMCSVFSWWGFLLVKNGLVRQCCFWSEMFLFCFTSVQGSVLVLGWSKMITTHSKILNGVVWVWSRSFGWDCLWGIIFVAFVLLCFSVGDIHWVDVVVCCTFWLIKIFNHLIFLCLIRQYIPYIFCLGDLSINKI